MDVTFHRKKLGELDSIQRYLNRKLSANAVQSVSLDDCSAEREQQGEQDTRHLVLQSRQLVGGVSSVITGELQFRRDMNNHHCVLVNVQTNIFCPFYACN